MTVRKWSGQPVLSSLDDNDYFLVVDATELVLKDKQKRMTSQVLDIRTLATVQKTNNATGFNIQGGTANRNLIVTSNATIDQNLSTVSSVTFANVTATTKLEARAGWLAGVVGGTSGDRVVSGIINGVATIGAHNFALSAWANLAIAPEGLSNVGLGLIHSASQTANARFHSSGSTILGVATTAVADNLIYINQCNHWIDETNNILHFKAKKSNSGILDFPVKVGKTIRLISSATYTTTAIDDIIICNASSNAVEITVDTALMLRDIQIIKISGGFAVTYKPNSGQNINGSSNTLSISNVNGSVTITPSNLTTNAITTSHTGNVIQLATSASTILNNDADIVYIDTTSNAVNLVVNANQLLTKNIQVVYRTGGNAASYQSDIGQTINGLSTAIVLAAQYDSAVIGAFSATAMFKK
jgi:hypothetical protein